MHMALLLQHAKKKRQAAACRKTISTLFFLFKIDQVDIALLFRLTVIAKEIMISSDYYFMIVLPCALRYNYTVFIW